MRKSVRSFMFSTTLSTIYSTFLILPAIYHLEHSTLSLTQIIQNNRLVIVDIYAPWCSPCKNMHNILETVSKQNKEILIIKVNIEECNDVIDLYNIKSIPTLLFFRNNIKITQKSGILSAKTIKSIINNIS